MTFHSSRCKYQKCILKALIPSGDVEAETTLKIIRRCVLEGSTLILTPLKPISAYVWRDGHEAVNHLVGVWGEEECHINGCRVLFRPWLAVHRSAYKDNLVLYLVAFKVCRSLEV